MTLAWLVDGVLFVARAGKTKAVDVKHAELRLRQVSAPLLGAVLLGPHADRAAMPSDLDAPEQLVRTARRMARASTTRRRGIIRRSGRTSSFSMSDGRVMLPVSTRADGASPTAAGRITPRRVAFFFLLLFAASVPLEAIAHLGPLGSTARVAGIAAAASGAYALCTDLRARPANSTFFVFGAFVVWIALSYFWSEDPSKTFARASTCMQLLLLAWLIWQEARTSRACVALMKAYIAGAAFACADAIITHHPVHNGVPRFSIGDPNDFGVVVVIAMVMAYHVAVTSSSRLTRVACALFLPLGALAIFLTASRTAVVALLVATLVMLFDRRNLGTRRLAVIALMTASHGARRRAQRESVAARPHRDHTIGGDGRITRPAHHAVGDQLAHVRRPSDPRRRRRNVS